MKLWRVVSDRFATSALTGEGAKRVGGRWSSPGQAVVYSSASKSGALLEVVAHSGTTLPEATQTLRFLRIDVSDEISRQRIDPSELPQGWNSFPPPAATRAFGDAWLSRAQSCLLKVPSASAPGEATYLINPAHRDFDLLVPHPPETFDSYESYAEESFGRKDLFLCHASEDKNAVVRPLRDALFDRGVSCWLDEAELTIGDSITEKVSAGLAQASFVLVVVSPAFLRKNWPKRELQAALNREARQGIKVILPIVVHYPDERVDFAAALPLAEDKLYYTWKGDAAAAATEIEKALRRAES